MNLKDLIALNEKKADEYISKRKEIEDEQPSKVKITAKDSKGKEIKEKTPKAINKVDSPTFMPYNKANTKDKLEADAERYAIIMTNNKPNANLKPHEEEYIKMVSNGEWGPSKKPEKFKKKLEQFK